ncbi:helix-hairpin-helix domain-containing protein [Orbus mooreae]|uniref:helix-hairpin-helix domain-containing protein n=1 Tax=Orbus mooreae TaxID=3074107 RepID=UPI00370D59CB
MAFSKAEYAQLIALKFVGEKVIERLEQMEFDSFTKLRSTNLDEILAKGALLSGSSCWKNSPQARSAIINILQCVNQAN